MSDPDFYGFVELQPLNTFEDRRADAVQLQRKYGATFCRFTIINDEYPNEPYPHGLYIEGWRVQPNPQPPFDYPLTPVTGDKDGV